MNYTCNYNQNRLEFITQCVLLDITNSSYLSIVNTAIFDKATCIIRNLYMIQSNLYLDMARDITGDQTIDIIYIHYNNCNYVVINDFDTITLDE